MPPPGSEGAMGIHKEMLRELMRNPEQMNILLESAFSASTVSEQNKNLVRERLKKMTEMSRNDPGQLEKMFDTMFANDLNDLNDPNNLINNLIKNPHMNPFLQTGGQPGRQTPFPGQAFPEGEEYSYQEDPYNSAFLPPKDFNRDAALAKYSKELEQLKEIGYSDEKLNLLALFFTDGDLTKAVNLILDWKNERQQ